MDLRAVIFVPALAGCVILGFVFALFAAHHYLTVLQSFGAGAKEVAWPAEPLIDQFWKVFYLAWMIGLWLGPAWLLTATLTSPNDPLWIRYAVPLAIFWICYPVSQLSSLGGPTIWLPVHPGVIERLVRKAAALPGFLLLSGLVLAAFGLCFYLTFFAPGIIWLFIGCVGFVVTGLLYASILGRLAFAIMFTRSTLSRFGRKRRKKAKRPDTDPPADPEEAEAGEVAQPSSLPPIETPDEGPLTGYDLAVDSSPARTRKRVVAEAVREEVESDAFPLLDDPDREPNAPPGSSEPEEDEGRPYEVNAAEVQPDERAPREVIKPSEEEMKLHSRDDAVKPPKRLWTPDLAAFLAQPGSLSVVATLSAMCFAVGGMVRIAREFNPAQD